MAAKPLGLTVGLREGHGAREELIEKIKVAEDVGIDSVWAGEAWGRDAVTLLTQIALNTSRVRLGTSILPIFGRSPALLAMTMATLDEISGGRVILGLGTSGARVIEHWHGERYDKPLTRMREYIEIFNKIIAGERLNYDGELFKLNLGFRLQFEPVRSKIPVFIASLTPKSIRLTGEIADGWMPIHWPRHAFPRAINLLREAAQKAGRDPYSITVAPSMRVYVTDDWEQAALRERQTLAFYIGRMGVFYKEMLTRNGYPEEVEACLAAWERRDAEGAARAISDDMVNDIAAIGSLDECRRKLDEFRAAGVDMPIIAMPEGPKQRVAEVLEALVA